VTVRGVAWRITWPIRKSSKQLPGLVFAIFLIVLVCGAPGLPGALHTARAADGKAFTQP
jgi:hypothetical protein